MAYPGGPPLQQVGQQRRQRQQPAPAAVQGDETGEQPYLEQVEPFRITPLLGVSALAAVLGVASAFTDVATVLLAVGSTLTE